MKPSLVIVGLGNPGASYEKTRHNLGFLAADELAKEFGEGEWRDQPKFQALTQEARLVTFPVLLAKPQTYMNDSGKSIRKLVDFYKLNPATQLLVVSDDIDLPLGDVRFRKSGGPGTHNGLKSIVETLGEGFARLRLGLGQPENGEDLAAWVLSVPSAKETEVLRKVLRSLPDKVREFVLNASDEEAASDNESNSAKSE